MPPGTPSLEPPSPVQIQHCLQVSISPFSAFKAKLLSQIMLQMASFFRKPIPTLQAAPARWLEPEKGNHKRGQASPKM